MSRRSPPRCARSCDLASFVAGASLALAIRMRSIAGLLILATPLAAHAEPPSLTPLVEPAAPLVEEHTSYRVYTLTADGLSIGALLLGAASESATGRDSDATGGLYTVGLLGGAFVTPIIHGMRGHGGRALGSYLLRSGLMGIGGMIGVASAGRCADTEWFCGLDRMVPGMAGGLVAASVLDAVFLTDETVERPSGPQWTPIVAPRAGGATVGLVAAF